MFCRICTPDNPYSEHTEEFYDYEYVVAPSNFSQCSCPHPLREDVEEVEAEYAKDFAQAISNLHDVSDIVKQLTDMDPDNETQVNALVEGIAFYDNSVTDQYGDVLMEGEVASDLRVLKISAQVDYVSDLEDYCKLLRGDVNNLVYCERRDERVHSPLRIMDMMRELTTNHPESLVLDCYKDFEEQGLDVSEYEDARALKVTVHYPLDEYTYTYLIDRAQRKAYLLG